MSSEALRDRFWTERPWGDSFEFVRLESHVVPTRGRSGVWILDEVRITYRERTLRALLAFAPRLQPGAVTALASRLTRAMRESLANRLERAPIPAVMVEVASDALLVACRRERLAVFDLAGTVDLQTDETLLQIRGGRHVSRTLKVTPFSVLGVRVARALLLTLHAPLPVSQLARELHASYSSVWSALSGLEKLGLVEKTHGLPPRVVDPRGLLQRWCERGAAPIREGWFCPNTSALRLRDGLSTLERSGGKGVFTYRSALKDDEVQVSGLPHGVRSAASTSLLVQAFGLRPVTPQNFFIVRDRAEASGFGGVDMSPRDVEAGLAVSVPQLVFDLHHAGGRAAEQAQASMASWWRGLPARPLHD